MFSPGRNGPTSPCHQLKIGLVSVKMIDLQAALAQLVERLIRNFQLHLYVIDAAVGQDSVLSANSAHWALFEPDSEPNFWPGMNWGFRRS
jgi:hypothetical protein